MNWIENEKTQKLKKKIIWHFTYICIVHIYKVYIKKISSLEKSKEIISCLNYH